MPHSISKTGFSLFTLLAILFFTFPSSTAKAEKTILKNDNFEVRLNKGQFMTRYRLEDTSNGIRKHNTAQYKALMDITVSFFQDKVRINLAAQSGSSFGGCCNGTDAGTNKDWGSDFNIRRLSLAVKASEVVEFEMGSMEPEYGAGSQDTYLDSDGYVMGYRARVSLEKSDIVVTGGFLGEFDNPNVFNRLDGMADFNYIQAVLNHAITSMVVGSLDYTRFDQENFARAAIKIDISKWVAFVDSLLIENMVKVDGMDDRDKLVNTFAVTLQKKFEDILPGDRDLQLALTYSHATGDFPFPINDKIWEGHTVRLVAKIPDFIKTKMMKLGLFVGFVQSLSDWDRFRAEMGFYLDF